MVAPRKPFRPVDFSKQGEISSYEPSRPSDRLRRGILSMFAEEPDPVTRQSRVGNVENILSMFKVPALADAGYDMTKAVLQPSMQSALTAGGSLLGVAAPMPGKAKWAPRVTKTVEQAIQKRLLPQGNYVRPLEAEVSHLYREASPSNFIEMWQGPTPYGQSRFHFAEAPEMALGQGKNKGVTFKVRTPGLKGRTNLDKPFLDKMYEDRSGEFVVYSNPRDIVQNIEEVTVSPKAYEGLQGWEINQLNGRLKYLAANGAKVTGMHYPKHKGPEKW